MSGKRTISTRKTVLTVLFLLSVFAAGAQTGDDLYIIMDTSDYQPYPEGLDINLSIASSKGYTIEINRLIGRGADINNRDEIGASPVIYAVANNKKLALQTLLEYSPDLDIRTYDGESALHIAVLNRNLELAEMLIRDSASINIRDARLCTPLHFAAAYDYFYLTDLLVYYEADIDALSSDSTTALMAAVWAGNAEIADLLIINGADVNLADSRGFTPLLIAAQNSDTLLTRILLDAGADIGAYTNSNYDAGAIAAITGDTGYSKYLVERTPWLQSRRNESVDPIIIARKAGKNNTYNYFRSVFNSKMPVINFDRVNLMLTTKLNGDFYMGGQLAYVDPLLRVRVNTGMEFKPGYSRVYVRESDDLIYQYADKRYLVFAGLGKEFLLSEKYFKGSTSLIFNINLGYMFSSYYRGTYVKPDNKLLLMPSIGIERSIRNLSITCLYEYMNTGLYKPGPHWFKLGASYDFHFGNKVSDLKNIKWY